MHCPGNGQCLTSSTRGKLICERKCMLLECPNFKICRNKEAEFILAFHIGVCRECYSKYGPCPENPNPSNPILEIEDVDDEKIECPVCLSEYTTFKVKCPRCMHWLCKSCLDMIFSSSTAFRDPPKFPLSSEDEILFYKNPELFFMDEVVQKWRRKYQKWETDRVLHVCKNQKYIKHCPICRA